MLGRTPRANVVVDPDGSTDPTSAAFSPLVTNSPELRGVRKEVTQPDDVRTQAQFTTGAWGDPFRGFSKYVNQTVGGQAGNSQTLGWSTGLKPRKDSRPPLTGRVLVVPNMGVHPTIGNVGRDNRANKLFAGVASQQNDYQPLTTAEIAQQFTGRGIQLGEG